MLGWDASLGEVGAHWDFDAADECVVGAGECVDAVVWVAWGKAESSSRSALVWRPRTILRSPFSAAAAMRRARTDLGGAVAWWVVRRCGRFKVGGLPVDSPRR